MKFSGKMCLIIILKVTKNQGLTLSLEDKYFEKLQGGDPLPPAVLGLNVRIEKNNLSTIHDFFQIYFSKIKPIF